MEYAGHCHDYSGGAWTDFGGCACGASSFTCWFGECSMVSSTTSFWCWALIALWQFVTKGGVHIVHGDRGSFCFGVHRLYLGTPWCISFYFGSWYIFWWCISVLWVVYVRGRHFVLCFFYCFLIHMCYIGYWFILWGYSWYTSFIFLFCEIKNFILFYLYFPHMRLCVCWVFQ